MQLLAELNNISLNKNIPLFLTLELTKKCPLNCIHCYLPTSHKIEKIKKEIDIGDIKKIIPQLKKLKTMFVTLTGGEVLLLKDIVDIVKIFIDNNFSVKIFSSLYIKNKEILKELYKAGLIEVEVSLYGREKAHNKITGYKSFNTTVSNILYARELGYKITTKTPLMNVNIKDIKWIYKFSRKHQLEFQIDPVITPMDNGNKKPLEYQPSSDEIYSILSDRNINNFDFENFKCGTSQKYIPCGALKNLFAIDSYGNILPCLAFPYKLGNIKKDDIYRLWNSAKVKKIRKQFEKEPDVCRKCLYRGYCSRCIGVSYVHGDINYIYDSACNLAEKMYAESQKQSA